MNVLLALPAVAVTLCLFAIWFGVEDVPVRHRRLRLDRACALSPPPSAWSWRAGRRPPRRTRQPPGVAADPGRPSPPSCRSRGTRTRGADPIVDVRLMRSPGQWPVQLTAFLFGMSVLGAQIPLSTFARTDPAVAGYGLGRRCEFVSILVGLYVVFLAIGAFTLPVTSRAARPARRARIVRPARRAGVRPLASRSTTPPVRRWSTWPSPASARAHWSPRCRPPPRPRAPPERTAFATGMTNATKTVGGAIASAIFAIALASTGSIADPEEGPRPAGRLPHRLVDLRDRRTPGRRGPADPPQAARRAPGQLDRSA
jgi:hypothetical protein